MITYNGIIMAMDGIWVGPKIVDPYNPLNLPPNTIRCKFSAGYTPDMGDTQTLVDADNNIWDIFEAGSDWSNLFDHNSYLLEVIGANTTNVTNMHYMFNSCSSLTTIPLFDTSNVTDMSFIFAGCSSLTTVPLFDTSNVTNMQCMFDSCSSLTIVPLFNTSEVTNVVSMFWEAYSLTTVPLFDTSKVTNSDYMFAYCFNVESGALALYNQMANQAVPPIRHTSTFHACGKDTETGAAELAQIPEDWK